MRINSTKLQSNQSHQTWKIYWIRLLRSIRKCILSSCLTIHFLTYFVNVFSIWTFSVLSFIHSFVSMCVCVNVSKIGFQTKSEKILSQIIAMHTRETKRERRELEQDRNASRALFWFANMEYEFVKRVKSIYILPYTNILRL